MTVTINGTTGVSAIQDATVTSAKIVTGAATPDKLSGLTITTSQTTPLPGTATAMSYTHGLGVVPVSAELEVVCLTAEFGYAVGDVVTPFTFGNGTYASPFAVMKNVTVVYAVTGSFRAWDVLNKATGAAVGGLTAANWAWRFKIRVA